MENLLLALDRPLGVLPIGFSLRAGLLTYVGLPTELAPYAAGLGVACLVPGVLLRWGLGPLRRAPIGIDRTSDTRAGETL